MESNNPDDQLLELPIVETGGTGAAYPGHPLLARAMRLCRVTH